MTHDNIETKTEEEIKYEREMEENDRKRRKAIIILNICCFTCVAIVCIYELWWKKTPL